MIEKADQSDEVSSRGRLEAALLIAALCYPFFLRAAHDNAQLAHNAATSADYLGYAASSIAALILTFGVPIFAYAALRVVRHEWPSAPIALRTVRLCHAVFAAPPLYTAIGVLTYVAGVSAIDSIIWIAFWITLAAVGRSATADHSRKSPRLSRMRAAHGLFALTVIIGFLIVHQANHLLALWSVDLHGHAMHWLERFYRGAWVEPVLILTFLMLVGSGIMLAWRRVSTGHRSTFDDLQTLTGAYLASFIVSHLTAIVLMARWLRHIPTDWAFASGAPDGLVANAWNIRLIPHYAIAVWALCAPMARPTP